MFNRGAVFKCSISRGPVVRCSKDAPWFNLHRGRICFEILVPPSLHTSNSPIMNTLPVQGIHWRARERIGQPLYANAKKSEVANTSFFFWGGGGFEF